MFLLILGLVVLGPEKLPTVLRKMGKFYGEFKRMTGDAQSDFRQAFAEPLRDLQSAATEYKSVFQEAAGEITDYSTVTASSLFFKSVTSIQPGLWVIQKGNLAASKAT